MTEIRRPGVVYGLDVIDHESWMAGTPVIMPNDYVGQTRQKGRARENQHRDTQAFSDLIVGSPRVLWEGLCTDAELDAIEARFIREGVNGVRPRLNYLLNEDNPERIPKWIQKDQRHARDDQAGRPRWQPVDQRARTGLLDAPAWVDRRTAAPVQPSRLTRSWSPAQIKVCLWSAGWALMQVTVLAGLDHYRLPTTWATVVGTGTPTYAALLAWTWAGFPTTQRQARSAWRQWRRTAKRRRARADR